MNRGEQRSYVSRKKIEEGVQRACESESEGVRLFLSREREGSRESEESFSVVYG